MMRPWTIEMTTPGAGTVRAVIWQRETDGYLVSIGGTIPRSAYQTIADTLTEAIAFAQAEIAEHAATQMPRYAVWYASVGCLPDGDGPEMVGTEAECLAYVAECEAEADPSPHNLYQFTVEPWDGDDD
jgi:hypothetical protein